MLPVITALIIGLIVGGAIGVAVMILVPYFKEKRAKSNAEKIIHDAEVKADHIQKNAKIDAKTLTNELKAAAEKEIKERKQIVAESEKKLAQREQAIDRRDASLSTKEDALEQKKETYNNRLAALDKKEDELQLKIDSIIAELEKVAQMSVSEAHDELMRRVEEKMNKEIAAYIKNREDEAEEQADGKAKDIMSLAMSKYAQEVTNERTVSIVSLPSDEMKGRIIGREGRNIKSLESLLGVDIIIDDTPEVITVSCFDPVRREVARMTLDRLIKDGRIQPGRIEEIFNKCKEEVHQSVVKAGEQAVFKLGLPRMHKELLEYVGRLKYRTSYGQNVLDHSIQVAYLAGIMAAELGLDQTLAKRAGLLHDIGKSADFEMDGSHVEVGARLAKKYGEPDVVINAIESHHGDKPSKYVISNLVQAADTLSAARPGARSETLENYIKRIEDLENICKSYEGVQNCYAMQSGREVRVTVIPDKVDDLQAFKMARDIKDKIQNEMTYPGQIKVSVIRELRAVEVAK
ncbi:MAG TPA: ribonuclease Y [Firmicutes bacterium]|nr:ribonuclease Y [Bacillota bacterium]HAX00010.1 ribonuclease Y [Bacillota bacterium]